jgi:hypothetical protein
MARKTMLSQLLEQRIPQKESERVFHILLLWMDNIEPGTPWSFAEGYKTFMKMSWGEFVNQCNADMFLIIDEVQKIYKPEDRDESYHRGDIFQFGKHLSTSTRFHIVAFALYGHYGAYTTCEKHAVMDILPTNNLKGNNKWDLTMFTLLKRI